MPGIPRGSAGPEEPGPQEDQPTTELAAPAAPPPPAPEGATAATAAPATPAEETPAEPADTDRPRFRRRAQMRRRLRYLRRLREIAFRDLGGLVFDLHRFGRERGDLVEAKIAALAAIDAELRTLEDALDDRRDYTDLREAGIAACPHCGTLHDSDAGFCPGCGASLRGAEAHAPATQSPEQPAEQPPAATTTPS